MNNTCAIRVSSIFRCEGIMRDTDPGIVHPAPDFEDNAGLIWSAYADLMAQQCLQRANDVKQAADAARRDLDFLLGILNNTQNPKTQARVEAEIEFDQQVIKFLESRLDF